MKTNTYKGSRELSDRFRKVIPGGAHTYAKGDDQYPENFLPYITHGKGCHIWDVDGNEYIEYAMGLRSVTLGHAFDPVDDAVIQQLKLGINFNRPSPVELFCAEELLSLLDNGHDMVKFAKNGSDSTTAALKLARAFTGRNLVAICAEHPFFSVDDWFIGATPLTSGIPDAVIAQTLKFNYNNPESLKQLFERYPNQIAAVFLEAEKEVAPVEGFLQQVKLLCQQNGAVFILDEIITGFRYHLGGAQKLHNIQADLSTYGKAIANGYSLSALTGKREIMELGGLEHKKERVFLLSTTYGAETHSLAAARTTMKIYQENNVIDYLYHVGDALRTGIQKSIDELKLNNYFRVLGRSCCMVYTTRDEKMEPSQPFRTLFLQETIRRGLLMPSLIVSYSHTEQDVKRTTESIHEALTIYRKAINEGVEKYLEGRAVKPVYRKYN
jgi:glutamate-1-semialdehyde 2,1-aminomutase